MKKIVSLIACLLMICNMTLPAFGTAAAKPAADGTKTDTAAPAANPTAPAADPATPAVAETVPVVPLNPVADAGAAALSVTSDAYVVMDAKTGQVLISKNPDKKEKPASITKILTTALALENLKATDPHTITKEDVFPADFPKGFSSSTHVALDTNEEVTVESLLYATMVASANDAANALANAAAAAAKKSVTLSDGSASFTSGFVQMMNEKAKSLGAVNSLFSNPHGLENENHYTTAFDMALFTRYAMSVPTFQKYFSATEYTMPADNVKKNPLPLGRNHEGMMEPSNENYFEGTIGVKLGWTTQSNHTGVAVSERDGKTLISVALNCTGSNAYAVQHDMMNLLTYCFDNFTPVTFTPEDLNLKLMTTPVYDKRGGAPGEGKIVGVATLSTDSNFTLLLHKNYTKEDIVVSSSVPGRYYQSEDMPSTLKFSLKKTAETQYMVPDMAALKLKVQVVTYDELAQQKDAARKAQVDGIVKILKYIGLGFIVLIVIVVLLRIVNKRRYRKRQQRRRNAQARRRKLQK